MSPAPRSPQQARGIAILRLVGIGALTFAAAAFMTLLLRLVERPAAITIPQRAVVASANASFALPQQWQPLGTVYFANGSDRLAPAASQLLRQWADALRNCPAAKLQVTGFASAAPFAPGSQRDNHGLAMDRARAVVAHLRGVSPDMEIADRTGASEAEVLDNRPFEDQVDRKRLQAVEALNRRVDIHIKSGSCLRQKRDIG